MQAICVTLFMDSFCTDVYMFTTCCTGRPVIPSIPKIQRLIEAAWQKGFDLQGSGQLGGKVINTTKWIGATEIVATLSALKIKYVTALAFSRRLPTATLNITVLTKYFCYNNCCIELFFDATE